MGKLAWLCRDEPDEDWTLLSEKPESWRFREVKRIFYFEVEGD